MENLSILGVALQDQSTQQIRSQALGLFDTIKSNPLGWKIISSAVDSEEYFALDGQSQFACVVLLQSYIKDHHRCSASADKSSFRVFALNLLKKMVLLGPSLPKYLKLKAAGLLSMLFVVDYPEEWPAFFQEILLFVDMGTGGIDMFLEVLLTINSDISDREIYRTDAEFERHILIKDTMRDTCVSTLSTFWKHILKHELPSDTHNLCLSVIAGYIQWIDISEIANDEVVPFLLGFCSKLDTRKSAIDCIDAICRKGMLPVAKMSLMDSFFNILVENGFLNISSYEDNEDDVEFLCGISNFLNGCLIQLSDIFKEYNRKDFAVANAAFESMEKKSSYMITLIGHEDDDVSKAVLPCARELILCLKQVTMTAERKNISTSVLSAVVEKYRITEDGDASSDDEQDFSIYRQELKIVFDNLAKLDNVQVGQYVERYFMNVIPSWRDGQSFDKVELAISLLYLLGESLPHISGNIFASESPCTTFVCNMLHELMRSGVNEFDHPAVSLSFHEAVVRYDKFFAAPSNADYIKAILGSFTDQRGMLSKYAAVRGRCSYLFCRFVKLLRTTVVTHGDWLLQRIEQVLMLSLSGSTNNSPSSEDCQYLFEAVGVLIQFCPPEFAPEMMRRALTPIKSQIQISITAFNAAGDSIADQTVADRLSENISYASRLTKAFNGPAQLESSSCTQILTETLAMVIKALQLPNVPEVSLPPFYTAIRGYLHRMVICLGEGILAYLPEIARALLSRPPNGFVSAFTEFIPLINQIIAKYKKQSVVVLREIFMPLLEVFSRLDSPDWLNALGVTSTNDSATEAELRSGMKRAFFTFINTIIANEAYVVISEQGASVEWAVLMAVVDGVVNFPDPVTQKLCLSILKKFMETSQGNGDIEQFTYLHVIPACFSISANPNFNVKDAQSNMALMEAGGALKFCFEKYGERVVDHLRDTYLPSQKLAQSQIQSLCEALRTLEVKRFKEFFRDWLLKVLSG